MIKSFRIFQESKENKFPNIKTIKIEDFTVLIGKDSKSNDYLSTILASDDDMWFHAKGVPGSHVLIRINDKLPTLEVIKEVAKLAAKNSKAKDQAKVVYCKAKFVTKSSDMKDGQVSVDYNNAYEIDIEI